MGWTCEFEDRSARCCSLSRSMSVPVHFVKSGFDCPHPLFWLWETAKVLSTLPLMSCRHESSSVIYGVSALFTVAHPSACDYTIDMPSPHVPSIIVSGFARPSSPLSKPPPVGFFGLVSLLSPPLTACPLSDLGKA